MKDSARGLGVVLFFLFVFAKLESGFTDSGSRDSEINGVFGVSNVLFFLRIGRAPCCRLDWDLVKVTSDGHEGIRMFLFLFFCCLR
ncbi:hypothetical protein EX30DRAFT_128697 [Ascodesmis nigricans]|uniref:Secreted protein n=1 Tax=Ascodesmis nigricans TaxID=341454 RepID=A0A4S2MNV7_9PEZI|nr:hypothetical protein EX30DRAFT_128697 [Ascodesmis nigricans]